MAAHSHNYDPSPLEAQERLDGDLKDADKIEEAIIEYLMQRELDYVIDPDYLQIK